MRQCRRYTQEERDFMKEYVPGHSHKEILEAFNERFSPAMSARQLKNFLANNTGKTGRFEKGHVPSNKGKTVSKEMYDVMAPTMFKPGQKPPNTLPIGTEKMLADGYIWVKIDDKPKVPKRVNWVQKHVLLWEQHNGPVPEGCVIKFLDDDRTNITIENLQLITKAQNARLNQSGLHGPDPEMTKLGIMAADLIMATAAAKRRSKEGK